MPSEQVSPTKRLYWDDDHCLEAEALVVAMQNNSMAFDRTCFYPGGGGQPCDTGTVLLQSQYEVPIVGVESGPAGVIWHTTETVPPNILGQHVLLKVNPERRRSLSRYHTVLHVLNTIALRDYGAWITGVQIAEDYSRIDFKWDGFSAANLQDVEQKVNSVLDGNHPLKSFKMAEEEFQTRQDLLRTLEVKPPVIDGHVRVVEIEGFDAQACGGTHVATTSEVGKFSIFRTENKGKMNKRLYIHLHI